MPKQKWVCDKCKKSGEVEYKKHAGVYEVIHLIEDSHKETSPDCLQLVTMIRCPQED